MIDQWAEPIRFRETIETMHADGVRLFLEVGPRGNLTSFVDDTLAGREYAAVPCNLASRGGMLQFHHALAMLCAHGVRVNLDRLYVRRRPVRLPPEAAATGRRPLKLKMDIPLPSLDDADCRTLRDALRVALDGGNSGRTAPPPSEPPPANSPVMRSHMDTMDRILATHEEVMQAALLRSGATEAPVSAGNGD